MQSILVTAFFISNVVIYVISSKWRKKQNIQIHPFLFLIDYYIFVTPIIMLIGALSFPFIFITGNRVIDEVDYNLFVIGAYLVVSPALFLYNLYIVYPNLQFLFFRKIHRIQIYRLYKYIIVVFELVILFFLFSTVNYATLLLLICINLFLQHKVVEN
ncbi:hypothetical protein IIU_06020 [Bacillus cereus VD133]|uniref:Uncharacterized protein n=1 Tax=Bacillus cereus VD133 TaxID=1053233 RepID=A0A9W5PL17_BACCE|nr:hypothetical protein IIU_06020 [Bacillus cereus VD133]